jgi:hypothetical protein
MPDCYLPESVAVPRARPLRKAHPAQARSALPRIQGLAESNPMTDIESSELYHIPGHLLVLGGSYIGLEMVTGETPLWQQRYCD